MTRRLILLRHGRTAWNAERRFQGQADVPLDEVGRGQAAAAGEALADVDPALLWCSDLARAHETARAVGARVGVEPTTDRRLREIHVGRREGLTFDEFAEQDPVSHARWETGDRGFETIGGESTQQVAERVRAVVREAGEALPEGRTGVLVAHGAAIRIGLAAVLGWSDERLTDLAPLENCGWLELHDDHPTNGWRLAAYNRVPPDFASAAPAR